MRTDAEKNGAQFATQGDPRVTSIGRFLRKTRLDELPQLWNVLKGEMSGSSRNRVRARKTVAIPV